MPNLRLIEEGEATGALKAEYDAAIARAGKVFNIVKAMLKILPARPIAASYSAFSAPVASPSSMRAEIRHQPILPVSLLQVAFLVSECNKCPPGVEKRRRVERSDDVGYEAERQGSSDEEATNSRTDPQRRAATSPVF